MKKIIINVQTGEEVWQDYTEAELLEVEKAQTEQTARETAQAVKATAKAALLVKLGISEDEAKLLLS